MILPRCAVVQAHVESGDGSGDAELGDRLRDLLLRHAGRRELRPAHLDDALRGRPASPARCAVAPAPTSSSAPVTRPATWMPTRSSAPPSSQCALTRGPFARSITVDGVRASRRHPAAAARRRHRRRRRGGNRPWAGPGRAGRQGRRRAARPLTSAPRDDGERATATATAAKLRDRDRAQRRDALALIRHDAAHVLAAAVLELYPGVKISIGPPIEDGFYYDFEFPARRLDQRRRLRAHRGQDGASTSTPTSRSCAPR